MGNLTPPFLPAHFARSTPVSTDESQFGDCKVLLETESKLAVEIRMKRGRAVYRRLYFKQFPDQVQSEVLVLSKTQKKISLDDFSVYREIVSRAEKLAPGEGSPKAAQAPSALVLGAGCSVLGDCLRDKGYAPVLEVDIDAEVFEIGNRFFRSKRHKKFREGFQIVADAFEFVTKREAPARREVIVLDINGAECTPPKQFLQPEFFAGLSRFCGPASLVFVNLICGGALGAEELSQGAGANFEVTQLLRFESIKNELAILRLKG